MARTAVIAGVGLAVPTDVSDPDAVADAFDAVRDEFGLVDVLVNHASAGSWKGLLDASLEEFERGWAVNCRGAFLCSQEAVGDMLDGDGGTVIFTGATSAVRGGAARSVSRRRSSRPAGWPTNGALGRPATSASDK